MIVRDYRDVEAKPAGQAEGVTIRWVLAKQDGTPRFAMRVFEVEPGKATPHHQHWWEHEVLVLAGEGVVKSEDGDRPLREGTVVFVPGNEMHQFRNTGSGVLRFICVVPHTD